MDLHFQLGDKEVLRPCLMGATPSLPVIRNSCMKDKSLSYSIFNNFIQHRRPPIAK